MSVTQARFHLAFPINDIEETRKFYVETLGCSAGRATDHWIDFDFFGNQLSAHVSKDFKRDRDAKSLVDTIQVPVQHFGAILPWDAWHELKSRLEAANIDFVVKPYVRFRGDRGEQATMFFYDPSGNALEFKSFKDESKIFEK